jgi:DNA-binding MarR family transcriptional regulator
MNDIGHVSRRKPRNPARSPARDLAQNGGRNHAAGPALDHESRGHDDDHESLRLWLRIMTCSNLIETAIRARIRAEFKCTLPRFDLMAQLARHPEGLKMGELSRRLMVTSGNVTGITDQLASEGHVQREPLPNDRRAFLVKLTPAGRKTFQRMALEHEHWVIELFSHLSDEDRRALHGLLGTLKDGLTAADTQRAGKPG